MLHTMIETSDRCCTLLEREFIVNIYNELSMLEDNPNKENFKKFKESLDESLGRTYSDGYTDGVLDYIDIPNKIRKEARR